MTHKEILENALQKVRDAANSRSKTNAKTAGPKGAPLNIVPNPNADPDAAKKLLQAERFDKIKDIQSVNDEIDNLFNSFYKNHKDDFDGKNIKPDDFKKGILERVSGYGTNIAGLKPINDIFNDPKANEKDLLEVVKKAVHTKADELLKMPLFKTGDKIKVKITAGDIEDGWEVRVIDYNNNKVQVVKVEKDKNGNDKTLSKYVKINELAEWNDAKNSNPQEAEKVLSPEELKKKEEEKQKRKNEIEEIEKEVAKARKEYLEVDYKKTNALSRIRKFFGKNDISNEQDQDISFYKKEYEDKLEKWRKALVDDAKIDGAKDERLAELYKIFRIEQKITLADEHDNIKAEQQFGNNFGEIGKGIEYIVKKYQSLPLKAKLGIAAAFMVGGVAAAGLGGTAVGVATVFMAGRRVFGGAVAGYGTKWALEAHGQKKAKKETEKEKLKFLEELKDKDENDKFEKLNEKINNIIKKDEGDALRKIKNQDILQTAAGAAVGGFIGSGLMADFLKWGWHGATEKFGLGAGIDPKLKGTGFPKRPSVGIFANADQLASSNANAAAVSGNLSHLNNIGQDIAEGKNDIITPIPENVPGANAANVVDVKGKGFWGAIHDKLDKLEPGGKHNGETAKIFNRAVGEYAKSHGMTVAEATEKLSHVDKGTNFSMTQDAKGVWQANFDDQNIKFLHGLEHHAPSHAGVPSPEILTENVPPEIPKASSVIDQRGNLTAKIEANLGRIDALDHRQEELLGGFDRGIENATSDPNELLKVQQDIEQLREEVRGDRLKLNSLMDIDNAKGITTSAVELPFEDVKLASGSAVGAGAAIMGSKKILDKNRKNENAIGLVKMLKENVSTTKFLRATLERITGGSSHQISFWKEIKDQPFDVKKLSKNNKKIKLNMEDVILEFKEILGNEASPKKKADGKIETVNEWLRRVTQKSFEKNKQSN